MDALLFTAALLALLVLAGFLYQTAGSAVDRRRFPPPGRVIDIGGQRLHLIEAGQGSPAVLFESGIAASALNWSRVHAQVSRFTRAYSYDRAALGWSDPTSTPRIASRLIDELHALIQAASVPTPCILVGHSFGGLLVQAYAAKYPGQVAGLVLIDPLPAAEWMNINESQARMLRRGVRLSRRGALLARFGVVRFSLALLSGGVRQIPKLIARLSSGSGESTLSRLVGEVQKMPPEVWPMIQAHWCQPKCFRGMAAYLESLPASAMEVAALGEPREIPISILSAANSSPAQLAARDAMAHRSARGRHTVVENSGHWVHLDQPEAVIQAIREMVELAQPGGKQLGRLG